MNKFKRITFIYLSTLIITTFAFGGQYSVFAANSTIRVFMDGEEVKFPDAKPYISENRTLVPVRFISEQLGASVSWDSKTKTVAISKDKDDIKLFVGSREVFRNGKSSTIDVAPSIINDRTMVPLRFVSEQLGVDVDWESGEKSVIISTVEDYKDYTVKAGDTLWNIAKVSGMSLEEIQKANPELIPEKLRVGQQIKLFASAETEGLAAALPVKKEVASASEEKENGSALEKRGADASRGKSVSDTASEKEEIDKAQENKEKASSAEKKETKETKELVTTTKSIDFAVTYERTDLLRRGEKEIETKGAPGIQKVTVEVTKISGRIISEKAHKTEVIKKPENQVILVGTKTPAISRKSIPVSIKGTGEEIVDYAKEFIGVPYVYGGSTPEGFDCSGFTQYVAAYFGGYIPHEAAQQYNYGESVEKEDLQPGDLVFFEGYSDPFYIGHVGIYIGGGDFIHAPRTGENVKISSLSNVYYEEHFYGAVRILEKEITEDEIKDIK